MVLDFHGGPSPQTGPPDIGSLSMTIKPPRAPRHKDDRREEGEENDDERREIMRDERWNIGCDVIVCENEGNDECERS